MGGKTISHYHILEKIGEGGRGVVYKARDTHLDRLVAIKVLQPARVADSEDKRRLVQEARSASALNHPNIVTVHDMDQSDGVYLIAPARRSGGSRFATGGSGGNQMPSSFFVLRKTKTSVKLTRHHRSVPWANQPWRSRAVAR